VLAVVAPMPANATGHIGPQCQGHAATIVGTTDSETIVGTPGADVIVARGGDDRVLTRGGDDVVCGGPGGDRLLGEWGADELFGGGGSDVLDGGEGGSAWLLGGGGDDVLRGGDAADSIYGGGGTDLVVARGGDDFAAGGKGADIVRDGAGDDNTIEEGVGNIVRLGPGDDYEENRAVRTAVYGGDGADLIFGGAELLDGGDGDDEIHAYLLMPKAVEVDFSVSGGAGDDEIDFSNSTVAAGRVDLDGGPGLDAVVFVPPEDESDEPGVYVFSLGPDGTWSQPYTGAFAGIEAVSADVGTYQITGSEDPDWISVPEVEGSKLWGFGGDDYLHGAGEPGSIDGGDGFDMCTNSEEQTDCENDA
jgi:hypothetical protein